MAIMWKWVFHHEHGLLKAILDPALALFNATSPAWLERDAELCLGLGQRMFATDAGEYPLMDVRLIHLDSPDPEQDAPQPGAADAKAPDA